MHKVTRWHHPSNYAGQTWGDWFNAGFSQHRDSDALERANFQAAYAALPRGNEAGDEPSVQIVREGHWAVGWVEWIAIHESDEQALTIARELCAATNDYPVIDEELFSQLEDEECAETWERCYRPKERIEYFRSHGHTVTSLGALLRAVRGDWGEAASILHCPSDLIY